MHLHDIHILLNINYEIDKYTYFNLILGHWVLQRILNYVEIKSYFFKLQFLLKKIGIGKTYY